MSSKHIPKVLVIGGTGAQGIPVVRGLVQDGAYKVRALTRNSKSPQAQKLASLGDVELIEGTFANEDDLRRGFRGCDYAFVNIDGFNAGEKTETFWAMRSYELAIEEGIKFFVYGNLDFVYKKSGYNPKFRTGHYDGKGRVGEWILQQNKSNQDRMKAALFTTGPYIEMMISSTTVMTPSIEDGVLVWRVPLGDGAVVHVALDDCAYYVRWLFDHQDRANGMDLEVAIDHIPYDELAKAFEEVSGHPARYIPISMEDYWTKGPMAPVANKPSGYNSSSDDPATMSLRQNFTGFWNMWGASGPSNPNQVVKRDYKLLDEIHPNRIKSAKEWFTREQERGLNEGLGDLWERVNNLKPILKLNMDRRKGKL
jgi:NmrA-like family